VFVRSKALEGDDLQLRSLLDEPMLVVLPASHPAARSAKVDLRLMRDDALILTPRGIGQTLYDTVISACRRAGFEPILGQSAPQMGSVVNLVAAELVFPREVALTTRLSTPVERPASNLLSARSRRILHRS
jgi:DNA-binding transcriptional LysR family regulator